MIENLSFYFAVLDGLEFILLGMIMLGAILFIQSIYYLIRG